MVDVGDKFVSHRVAVAAGVIQMEAATFSMVAVVSGTLIGINSIS